MNNENIVPASEESKTSRAAYDLRQDEMPDGCYRALWRVETKEDFAGEMLSQVWWFVSQESADAYVAECRKLSIAVISIREALARVTTR